MLTSPGRSATAALVAFAFSTALSAQCGLQWQAGPPANGPNGNTSAVLALPNGDLVVGGTFRVADQVVAENIARWDGSTWQALGAGIGGNGATVRCLARLPNGDIVAGGAFQWAGGQAAANIARWNGMSWSPLGTGLDGAVTALQVMPNGDLIAAGFFQSAGALPARSVARWDGTSWSALGSGIAAFSLNALAVLQNGDLVAGGDLFPSAGYGLLRWDGAAWTPLPGLDAANSHQVMDLATLPNGDLVVTGTLRVLGVQQRVAVISGPTTVGLDAPFLPSALFAVSPSDIVIGGGSGMARWNGGTWTTIPDAPLRVQAIARDTNGRFVAASAPLTGSPASPAQRAVARYDGAGWITLGAPTAAVVRAMVRMANGDVVVGGDFTSFGGVAANNLARWDGQAWAALGQGVDGSVRALAAAPNGDLLVGGTFANAGGAPANHVARWNGSAWSTLGAGPQASPTFLAVAPSGEVMATFTPGPPQRFDGLGWSPIALLGTSLIANSVVALPNGDFVFGGLFLVPGTPGIVGLQRYGGGAATLIPGAPATVVTEMLLDQQGNLVVMGGGVRRWDGATWTVLPAINAQGLTALPNGDLVAGGALASLGGGTPSAVYRLEAAGWRSFGEITGGTALVVAASGQGDLFVAGGFQQASGLVSIGFARARATCPASVAVVGSGCSGGAGPVTLAAGTGPWAGGVFAATATGMTNNSIALQLVGTQPASQPLPGGAPGCSLFVQPLFVDALLPSGGTVVTTYRLPAQPALAGLTLRLQVVGVELGATGIVRLTSSNALQAVIGAL